MTETVITAVEKGKVALRELVLADPGPGEVQVRVAMTLVSPGTERALVLALENTSAAFPQDLGYSAVGTVEKVGDGVARFTAGDRVACFCLPHCSRGNVSQEFCVRLGEGTSWLEGAFVALGVICLQGVRKLRVELGESAMVLGLGPVGQLAVQLLRANGAVPVIGVDRVTSRLRMARENGADFALNASAQGWERDLRGATGDPGPHVVVESTGFPQPVATALDAARKFGRVALLGSTRGLTTVNFYATVHRKALTIVGAHIMGNPTHDSRPGFWTWQDDALAFLDLVAKKRIHVEPLVTRRVPYQHALDVYDELLRWDTEGMIHLIDWG
jgi:L-iditol 2-dehydrogenase